MLAQLKGNVGFDIYAIEDTELLPMAVTKVRTGLAIADYDSVITALSPSHNDRRIMHTTSLTVYPKIEGRSGMAAAGIFPVGNIIDPNYRGEICVTLANLGHEKWVINGPTEDEPGDRIAQFVFYACVTVPEMRFEEADEVVQTDRGSKGFGSSGR